MSATPEMAFSIVEVDDFAVGVWLHTAEDPSDARWNAAVDQLRALKKRRGGDLSRACSFVVTDGGAPTAVQRSRLFVELFEGRPYFASAVSNGMSNPLKRGIASVITFLNPAFRTFAPNQSRAALTHLGLPPRALPILWNELQLLQGRIPAVQTLRLVGGIEGLAASSVQRGAAEGSHEHLTQRPQT